METEKRQPRYSRLAPFSLRQQIEMAVAALNFFSPTEYEKNCKAIGRPETPGRTEPLEGSEFLRFLERTGRLAESSRYRARIAELLARLEKVGLLTLLGQGRDIFLGKRYYFLKELTSVERTSNLWLSEALGPQFIRNQFVDFTVQITGTNSAGDVHAGTGLVLSSKWLLTCAHVLRDMEVHDRQVIGGTEHKVVAAVPHSKIDVGLLRIEPDVPTLPGLVFRDPQLCESLYTLGYPRVPLARSAPLVMQSGEVTAPAVKLLHGADVFLYSAVARPGNSGGPIIASNGHVLGIVTEELALEGTQPASPFHAGISASIIAGALAELESTVHFPIEDYE
jgi:hypothetical protein